MRHLWPLVTRSWSANPGRCFASILSIFISTAAVIIVTSFYATARRGIETDLLGRWLGAADLSIRAAGAHWGGVDEKLAEDVARVPNVTVSTSRLQRRMVFLERTDRPDIFAAQTDHVDLIGIQPETERQFRSIMITEGRSLEPDDRGVVIVDDSFARTWSITVGGDLQLFMEGSSNVITLKAVGIHEGGRLGDFQRASIFVTLPDAQSITGETAKVSSIDVLLGDDSPKAVAAAQQEIENVIAARSLTSFCRVESSSALRNLLAEADRVTKLVFVLISSAAMLMAFFIILSTMSMSLHSRAGQLGTMRCIGMTRGQLAALIFAEVMPLGIVGTSLGVTVGVILARGLPQWITDIDIVVVISSFGLILAIISGLVTSIVSFLALLWHVARVSPLQALSPQAAPSRRVVAVICGAVGISLIIAHEWLIRVTGSEQWVEPVRAAATMGSLYFGHVLLLPLLVVILGPLIARLVSPALGLPHRLAVEQFARSYWRGAGVCVVLLVGLSLIVYTAMNAQAIRSIWDFPGRMPQAFVWTKENVPSERMDAVRGIKSVKSIATIVDVQCQVQPVKREGQTDIASFMDNIVRKLTKPVFVAGDVPLLLDWIKVTFVEGSKEDALEKLSRGGFVLIPTQTAKTLDVHVDDAIRITIDNRVEQFQIAGVIQSPPLDLLVTAFHAESYMQFAAAAVLIGTKRDLVERFGLDLVSMVICDLDLAPTPVPTPFFGIEPPDYTQDAVIVRAIIDWREGLPEEAEAIARIVPILQDWLNAGAKDRLPEEVVPDVQRYGRAMGALHWHWKRMSPERLWMRFRERLVLFRIANALGRPDSLLGSLRTLREQVDRGITHATTTLTWMPSIVLFVATIGIANLMMVSVQVRSRQFALLRAVGAERSQVLRLVLAEALSLGLLGSIAGVALGFHQAYSDNRITEKMIGFRTAFEIPVVDVGLAVGLALGVCLIAGLLPARRAAGSDVISALQVV